MLHYFLSALVWVLKKIPKNDHLYSYTIYSLDGQPYLTRTLFPRIFGQRYLLHHIHRKDQDRDMHNHPWDWAKTRILTGGYIEVRPEGTYVRKPGDTASLGAEDFHRISWVHPKTWTWFKAGPRDHGRKWGFATPNGFVPYDVYFEERGYEYVGVKS